MTLVFVALGAFIVGSGVTGMVARYFFLMGWEMGRDDRALDPGPVVGTIPPETAEETTEETTGPLFTVGETTGRHARLAWPAHEPTEQMAAVPAVSDEDRRANDADSLFVDTEDARDRYQEEVTT